MLPQKSTSIWNSNFQYFVAQSRSRHLPTRVLFKNSNISLDVCSKALPTTTPIRAIRTPIWDPCGTQSQGCGTYDVGALLPQTKRNFRGSKGPFRDPTRLPLAPGGVHNHSPGKSLLREIMQNGYKTCVILTFIVFFP